MRINYMIIMILILLIPINLKSQEQKIIGLGLNIPPLIGKTVSIDVDMSNKKLLSYSFGIGGMLKNQLPGTLYKIGEATYDHENSGIYVSGGVRYTPRIELNMSYFFIGTKILGGYFIQSAEYHDPFEEWFRDNEIPDDFYFKNDKVYSNGLFVAFALETGINIKLNNKFHAEIGLQGGHHIITTKRQVSNISSILPGLGALNIVGILKIKYVIEKNKK